MGTEIFSNLNWLAVLAGGVAYFLLGAIWYSFLFRNAWMKATGVDPNAPGAKSGVAGIMITSLVLMIITSLGLALFLSKVGPLTMMSGVKAGLVAGICFSAVSISITYLYEKRPFALHLINGGYTVVGSVLAGIVLAMWPK